MRTGKVPGFSTRRPRRNGCPKTGRLYIHLLVYPYRRLPVAFADRIEYAQLLHDRSEIRVAKGEFEIPVTKPDVEIPVIEVVLR